MESSRLRRLAAVLALGLAATAPASAQLPLPQPQLPTLPDVVGQARDTLPEVTRAAPLNDLRKLRLRDLVRANPRTLEIERGQAIVRHEVVAVAPTEEALAAARRAGYTLSARERLNGLDTSIVTLSAPQGVSTRRALARLRELDPAGIYDFNHLYSESGPISGSGPFAPKESAGGGSNGARIGLIDSGVDARALPGVRVEQRAFAGADATPALHGTAVASLMDGIAHIYAADVYGGATTGGSATAIARAFAWMAQERVGVVNVSLVGPPNQALQAIVAGMIARGILIVAAVGNDGPAAPPLYPASYPGVVGVTGVNARERVLVEAARGPQVDFAARGADMEAASPGGKTPVRGTSFAAPIVAALLAQRLNAPGVGAQRAVNDLTRAARDLGAAGRDEVYGAGLVGRAAVAHR
ncbi:MAG: S8 family serine peptidase [Hyphomonadaceae bacterium]|nr:S8 family serine peptidase [Hyphomonadaceae bacterium]